jgi:methylated-DNA-[protein]-cysteine S-methyltransferase
MISYTTVDTPLGGMLVAARAGGVAGVWFVGQKYYPAIGSDWIEEPENEQLCRAKTQIAEYFAGTRTAFDLPLDLEGTPFQRRVWGALCAIPHGETTTYGRLSEQLGGKGGARAVGAAVGRNPVSILVPCHRVIGRNGSLTGYAGGLDRKRALLRLESPEARPEPGGVGTDSVSEPREPTDS